MRASSATILTPYAVESLHSGNGPAIDQVTIVHADTGVSERIDVDAVIVNHGLRYNFGSIKEWGLDMDDWNAHVSSQWKRTSPESSRREIS